MTPQSATLMADYNRWMNERIYVAAAKLPAPELMADKGAFFGSIFGALNHIAVADTIWLIRFARHPAGFSTLLAAMRDVPSPTSLRQILAADVDELWSYRKRIDQTILQWANELKPEHMASTLAYTNMAGKPASKNFAGLLQHFFNHQTHHRGQVTALLFQAGIDVGVTDLLAVMPDA